MKKNISPTLKKGRRRKPAHLRRDKIAYTRYTPEEYDELEKYAARCGISTSNAIRTLSLLALQKLPEATDAQE